MFDESFERQASFESGTKAMYQTGKNGRRRLAKYELAVMAMVAMATPRANAVSNYVPPIVTTSNTTLYTSATAISPGRIAVDRAGNVFYIVNGGSSATLMEIPAATPAVQNTAPLTLITGLGQYNSNTAFVDAKGNLWVTVGNGTATLSTGTDYLALFEFPAVNGVPTTTGIPSGGESLSTLDATHCSAAPTAPCTWQNYKLNSPSSSPINGPQVADLFVDASGNVYFVDAYDNTSKGAYNVLAKVNLAAGGTATVLATNLPSSGHSQVAVDGGGNVFYFDATTSVVSQVSGGTLTTVGNSATTTGAQITTPTGVSADFFGNLYIASAAQLSEVPFEGTAVNFVDEFGIVIGLGTTTTNNISYGGGLDGNGNYFYASNGGAATKIQDLQINGYNFGSVAVGTLVTGPSLTVYFNAAEASLASYYPTGSPTANANATYLQSFPFSGTKSLSGGTSYTVGQSGTITMNFQPIHPGLLKGSYTPRSNGSNATIVNLQGTGIGPQPMFLPGVATALFSSAAASSTVATPVPLNGPLGLAVDTFGDVFVADQGNGKVVADCLATTTSNEAGNGSGTANSFCGNTGYLGAVVELGTGFTKPAAIALDGANNLYVVDSTANSVTEIQGANLASTTLVAASATFGTTALSSPNGIAVDGFANVFIADSGNNRVVQAHQFGALATNNVVYIPSATTFGGTALSNPTGLAVDAAGDLFIADTGNNRIVEYTPFGVATVLTTTGITLSAPTSVKVLPSGTLVVTDSANGVSLLVNGTGTVLPVGTFSLNAPKGVALDLAGNIYVSDTAGNRVLELAVSAPAPAAFASTGQGSTSKSNSTVVNNTGNAALVFSATPTINTGNANFNVLSSGTCMNGTSVTAGTGSCTVVTNFTPQTTGPLTGTVTLTDNQLAYTLNTTTSNETGTFATSGTQALALSGTGTAAATTPAATPTITPGTGTYTTVQTVTIADTTTGSSIYYTTDGTTPTTASTLYTGTITVSTSETIEAIAVATGYSTSAVATAVYTINLPPKAPGVLLSQTLLYGALTSGGALDGGNPAGNTMVVNSAGTVLVSTTYGGQIDQFTTSGASVLGSFSNPGPLAIDASNNLYIGGTYSNQITKIPYVAGAYAPVSTPSGATPTCTGTDTVECNLPSLSSAVSGYFSLYFDPSGNLFFSSRQGTTPYGIFECSAACLKSATPAAALLYQEPISSSAQLSLGGLAADQYGNLFFTDSIISGSLNSSNSYLKELTAATGGTGFASSPTTLYSYTTASPGNYDNQLDAVTVDAGGTVYFATQNDGLFALLNNKGTVSTSNPYTVSTLGAKELTTDGKGNFYVVGYNSTAGGDAVSRIAVGNLTVPTVAVNSTSTSTNVTAYLSDAACSSSPTVTFTSSTTEFSAATSAKCASTLVGSTAFPTTVTFKPAALGTRTATLTGTDSAGGTGTAIATGVGASLPNAATPTFNPAAGTYTTIQSVAISDTTVGATIYYTTDGSTPTTSSTVYTAPISVGVSETINAIATATGYNSSVTGSATYVVNLPTASTPTFSPAAGTYTSTQSVTISDTTSGATIYYTTNGTAPTTSSAIYTGPVSVGVTETLNAIAVATGYNTSATGTAAYTINLPAATPTFSVASGTYTTVQSVGITDATTGSTIYYTLDGSTPTTASTVYTAPVTVAVSENIKAIATATGSSVSAVATATYVINFPAAATPVILPGAGTYTTVQMVTITDATASSKIYYTLDGSTPTTASPVYSGALTVSTSETVKAIATANLYSTSAIAVATYTLNLPTPSFTMLINPGTLSVANGSSAGANITVTSVGTFSAPVTFACNGLPAGVTCTFTPATVTPTVTGATTALVVTVPPNFGSSNRGNGPLNRPLLPGATLALAVCWLGFRKRRSLSIALLLLLGVFAMAGLSGCGTNQHLQVSTVTVTGTSNGVTQNVNLILTLQ